jgi:hypothetical protein
MRDADTERAGAEERHDIGGKPGRIQGGIRDAVSSVCPLWSVEFPPHSPTQLQSASSSLFGWLVTDGWCWFVVREKYCWLVAGKPSEPGVELSTVLVVGFTSLSKQTIETI